MTADHMERCVPQRIWVWVIVALIMLALAVVLSRTGVAAPRVADCDLFTDVAIVSAMLAKHGVPANKAEVMLHDLYAFNPVGQLLANLVLTAAYRDKHKSKQPRDFATAFYTHCIENQGFVDEFLHGGTSTQQEKVQ